MKAAVHHEYGPPDVVRIEDVEKPVPRDDEVLVRIHATTISAPDWRFRKARSGFHPVAAEQSRFAEVKTLRQALT